jgi:hypothetical protein
MNLGKRIEQLERAVEQATAPERVIEVRCLCVRSREELALLDSLPPDPPDDRPPPPGQVRLKVLPSIEAADYLAQHGIILPIETKGEEQL